MKEFTLGEKIALLRNFRGLRQQELAAEIGLDPGILCKYEKDQHQPSIQILKDIAKTCRMHPIYFFDDVEPHQYEKVLDDLQYAFYLSSLPEQARDYMSIAIIAQYQFMVMEHSNPLKSLLPRVTGEASLAKSSDKYFALLKKKKHANV